MSDLEVVLDEFKGKTSQEFSEFQDAMSERLASTKEKIVASEQDLLNKEKVAVEMADSYVRSNAWRFAIIGAVMGFLVGYFMR